MLPGNPFSAFGIINGISASQDPNDKLGPVGYGEANFIQSQPMDYTVRFENDPEWATSPARWIRIYDTLDEAFNLDTFELKEFCLAGNFVSIGGGRDSFNQTVTLNIEGNDVLVDVKINLDRETRQLSAEFMAVDPETGWMLMDPENGILFPNDDSGRGDGSIRYVVTPKSDVASGTEITNLANIYFDFNDPIETPVAGNVIDNDAAAVSNLTAADTEDVSAKLLSWSGADNENGSGIACYTVEFSVNNGEWLRYRTVTVNSVLFSGADGDYQFRVRAVDNVGNVGGWETESFTISPPDHYENEWSVAIENAATIAVTSELLNPGRYTLSCGSDTPLNAKITVIDLDLNKTVATVTVKKGVLSSSKPLLLNGNYAIQVVSGDKGKTTGELAVDLTGEVFHLAGQMPDDFWLYAPELDCRPGTSLPGEWVGYGDAADYRSLALDSSGSYNFTLSGLENAAKLTVYEKVTDKKGAQSLKMVKSLTVTPKRDKSGTLVNSGTLSGLLLDADRTYYIAVAAPGASKGLNTGYDLTVGGTQFTLANQVQDGDWRNLNAVDPLGCGETVTGEWVGYGDAADYRRLTLNSSGSYDFTLSGLENAAKLTVYEKVIDKKGAQSLKVVKSLTVTPKRDKTGTLINSGTASGLLLDAAREYYVAVESTGAAKGLNTAYNLELSGTCFDNPNSQISNNFWGDAEVGELDLSEGVTGEWVGFGDATDFFRFELSAEQTGSYGFSLELDEAKFANMNLYKVTEKNGKEILTRLKSDKTGLVSLGEGEYAVEIFSADKGKGKKNTGYGISIELPDLEIWRQETAIAQMSDAECGLDQEDERMSRILIA